MAKNSTKDDSNESKKDESTLSNLIDLSKHTNPNYNAVLGEEGKIGGSIKVEKPDKKTWFKIHPDPDFSQNLYIAEAASGDGFKTKSYIVQGKDDATHQELLRELDDVRYCCCHLYATSTHQFKIWARKQWDGQDEEAEYHASARKAAEDAKLGFVKMKWAGGQYNWRSPRDPNRFHEPVWPTDQTMLEILNIAFRENIIADMEHPVVMEADGRASSGGR
tara:strand:+ start:1575 stop:2234 length:660 start_codon:yes stop_codon:yes gene_type:complete